MLVDKERGAPLSARIGCLVQALQYVDSPNRLKLRPCRSSSGHFPGKSFQLLAVAYSASHGPPSWSVLWLKVHVPKSNIVQARLIRRPNIFSLLLPGFVVVPRTAGSIIIPAVFCIRCVDDLRLSR